MYIARQNKGDLWRRYVFPYQLTALRPKSFWRPGSSNTMIIDFSRHDQFASAQKLARFFSKPDLGELVEVVESEDELDCLDVRLKEKFRLTPWETVEYALSRSFALELH